MIWPVDLSSDSNRHDHSFFTRQKKDIEIRTGGGGWLQKKKNGATFLSMMTGTEIFFCADFFFIDGFGFGDESGESSGFSGNWKNQNQNSTVFYENHSYKGGFPVWQVVFRVGPGRKRGERGKLRFKLSPISIFSFCFPRDFSPIPPFFDLFLEASE